MNTPESKASNRMISFTRHEPPSPAEISDLKCQLEQNVSEEDNEADAKKPNHALQVTAGMAVSFRAAAPGLPGSVTAPAPPPSPAGAAPSPRAAVLSTGVPGPPHLSLGSLGVITRFP